METKKESTFQKIVTPFKLVGYEKLYILWIFAVLFFGLINLFGSLLLGDVHGFFGNFENGIIYTYSISLCAPFVVDFLLEMLDKKRRELQPKYVSYKVLIIVINFTYLLVLAFLWNGQFKSNMWLQIGLGVFTIIFAFYMYCVTHMDKHKPNFDHIDDTPYHQKTDETVEQLTIKSSSASDSAALDFIKEMRGDSYE